MTDKKQEALDHVMKIFPAALFMTLTDPQITWLKSQDDQDPGMVQIIKQITKPVEIFKKFPADIATKPDSDFLDEVKDLATEAQVVKIVELRTQLFVPTEEETLDKLKSKAADEIIKQHEDDLGISEDQTPKKANEDDPEKSSNLISDNQYLEIMALAKKLDVEFEETDEELRQLTSDEAAGIIGGLRKEVRGKSKQPSAGAKKTSQDVTPTPSAYDFSRIFQYLKFWEWNRTLQILLVVGIFLGAIWTADTILFEDGQPRPPRPQITATLAVFDTTDDSAATATLAPQEVINNTPAGNLCSYSTTFPGFTASGGIKASDWFWTQLGYPSENITDTRIAEVEEYWTQYDLSLRDTINNAGYSISNLDVEIYMTIEVVCRLENLVNLDTVQLISTNNSNE